MRDKVGDQMSLSDDLIGLSGVYRNEHRYDEALEINEAIRSD